VTTTILHQVDHPSSLNTSLLNRGVHCQPFLGFRAYSVYSQCGLPSLEKLRGILTGSIQGGFVRERRFERNMSNIDCAIKFSELTTTSVDQLTTTTSVGLDASGKFVDDDILCTLDSEIDHPEGTVPLRYPAWQGTKWSFISGESRKRRVLHDSGAYAEAKASVGNSQDHEPPKMKRSSKTSCSDRVASKKAAGGEDPGSDLKPGSSVATSSVQPNAIKSRLEDDGIHPSRFGCFIHIHDDDWSVDPSVDSTFLPLFMIHVSNWQHSSRLSCNTVRVPYSQIHVRSKACQHSGRSRTSAISVLHAGSPVER